MNSGGTAETCAETQIDAAMKNSKPKAVLNEDNGGRSSKRKRTERTVRVYTSATVVNDGKSFWRWRARRMGCRVVNLLLRTRSAESIESAAGR